MDNCDNNHVLKKQKKKATKAVGVATKIPDTQFDVSLFFKPPSIFKRDAKI